MADIPYVATCVGIYKALSNRNTLSSLPGFWGKGTICGKHFPEEYSEFNHFLKATTTHQIAEPRFKPRFWLWSPCHFMNMLRSDLVRWAGQWVFSILLLCFSHHGNWAEGSYVSSHSTKAGLFHFVSWLLWPNFSLVSVVTKLAMGWT